MASSSSTSATRRQCGHGGADAGFIMTSDRGGLARSVTGRRSGCASIHRGRVPSGIRGSDKRPGQPGGRSRACRSISGEVPTREPSDARGPGRGQLSPRQRRGCAIVQSRERAAGFTRRHARGAHRRACLGPPRPDARERATLVIAAALIESKSDLGLGSSHVACTDGLR